MSGVRRVALTVRNVPTLAVGRWWDRGLPGFYLAVAPPSPRYPEGVRSFGVFYRIRRKQKRVSLGRHPLVPLAVARARARQILIAAKVHGRDAGRAVDAPGNLAELVEAWIKAPRERPHAAGTVREYRRILAEVRTSDAATLPLDDLRRDDLRQLVAPALARAPSMALHVRRMIRAAIAWGVREEFLERDPSAGWEAPAAARGRERVLRDDELAALWRATGEERGIGAEGQPRRAVGRQRAGLARLLILLAQRSGETAAMRWRDLDTRGRVWLIPGEHRKGGKAQAVPLSDPALAEIEELRPVTGDDERVFPWTAPDHRHWIRPLVTRAKRLGLVEHWTPHDLRRTAATGMARLGTSRSVIALILGHEMREGGSVTGIYDRFDRMPERAAALNAWAAHVGALVGPTRSTGRP